MIELVEWMEIVVHASDELIAESAAKTVPRGDDDLWASV